jgi:transposase-like protein
MDKMRRLLDRAVKDVMTGGLSEQPRHDPATYDVPLSAKQTKAIALLLAGRSITDVAKELGIRRQTLSGWLNHHYSFKLALEAERQALWQRSRDELMGLTGSALQVVRDHLKEGSLSAALGVIKTVGLGDRQLVLGADAARMEELEQDRPRIEHQIFLRDFSAYCAQRLDASDRSETDTEANTEAGAEV